MPNAKSSMIRYSVKDFREQFPNDDVCLEWLKDQQYPNGIFCKTCDKVTQHHKVASRKSYSCQSCGHHVHPTAGTIYHKSSTPLTDWFYAVYLMASTRCGISAKQIERELGVTYKTAWRMFKMIRSMLDESGDKLGGSVEMDETYVGGDAKNMHKDRKASIGKYGLRAGTSDHKTIVFGIVERQGRVKATVVKRATKNVLFPIIKETVDPKADVFTDQARVYEPLAKEFKHEVVNHSTWEFVRGNAHTNSIEGFWSLMKGGIKGVYKGRVEVKHLQDYVNEFAFRYNHRHDEQPMFLSFMNQVSQGR